jgi:hypothetical protein
MVFPVKVFTKDLHDGLKYHSSKEHEWIPVRGIRNQMEDGVTHIFKEEYGLLSCRALLR